MQPPHQPDPHGWSRRRRRELTQATAALLGMPVGAAVPLQRRHPAVVLGLAVAELAAFVALIVTADLAAFIAVATLAVLLVAVQATNRRRVLAVTSAGVVMLVASAAGTPLAQIGPAPDDLALPPPAGLGVAVRLGPASWWVERASFPRLRAARLLLGAPD